MKLKPEERLITALDVDRIEEAVRLVKLLKPLGLVHFKIGLQLFTLGGPDAVEAVQREGAKVFLDLKFHDIPNTVAGAVKSAALLGVWMVNVHTQGGGVMMRSAAVATGEKGTLVIGVTVLTSLAEKDMMELGVQRPLKEQVLQLARQAKEAGLNGIVASAQEAAEIRRACGEDFLIVTPGIRPKSDGQKKDDQQRVMGPREAIDAGSDYLVIGRPITEAPDPAEAARRILEECAGE